MSFCGNHCIPQPILANNYYDRARIKSIYRNVGSFVNGLNCFRRPSSPINYGFRSGFCPPPVYQSPCGVGGFSNAYGSPQYCRSSAFGSQVGSNAFGAYASGLQQGLQQGVAMASQFGGQCFNNIGSACNQAGSFIGGYNFPGANFASNTCTGVGNFFNNCGSAFNNYSQPIGQGQTNIINNNYIVNNTNSNNTSINNTNVNNTSINNFPTTNINNIQSFQQPYLPQFC